ncbi:MAG: response regulator [Candidatus Poribacteria bacterium]|jgi:DNA-binding NtrC family response regulator|nr:response regulator [Candidatus Poribacteria bacterium]MDP6994920.1 response regulator [Candidatus Poribacteria bacterium]
MMIDKPILVVDDDVATVTVVCEVLNRAGYETLSANDGYDALAQFQSNTLSLLISDLELPDTTGSDLLRHIRSRAPDLPAIIMSANRSLDTRLEAMDAGAYTFIPKPIYLPQFLQFVEKARVSAPGIQMGIPGSQQTSTTTISFSQPLSSGQKHHSERRSFFFKWTKIIKFRR